MATATHDASTATAVAVDPLLYRLPEFPSGIPLSSSPVMTTCDSDGITALISISGAAFPALVVGGEPRIPVHLLLSRVLATQGISEVQALMDDLNIHKSLANKEQTERLRTLDVEVLNTHDFSTMNLMTRSDAERVCGLVRIESDCPSGVESAVEESERLSVQHNMFGTVKGWVYPSRKGGRSVRCERCQCFFTPEDFVAHSHNVDREYRRTVHWGFDPSNWRLMLELVKPSSECDINRIRWKQFIDEPIEIPCHHLEGLKTGSTNKFKRSLEDDTMEVPPKAPRILSKPGISEEHLLTDRALSESSNILKLPSCGNLSNVYASKALDTPATLDDAAKNETGFETKSFTSISEHSSMTGMGQLLPINLKPVGGVFSPSNCKLDDTLLRLNSSCEKLECLELALKQSSAVDPAFISALREIRTSLVQCTVTEFERLQTAYDSLPTVLRQSYTPLSKYNDQLLRTAVSNFHAGPVTFGTTSSSDSSSAHVLNDLLQQQMKPVQPHQFGGISKSMVAAQLPFTGFTAPSNSQILNHMLIQQLMQVLSTQQQT
ncbi:hypothetical protein KIN20_001730 [Parelaphostrongylus tenuis]|uniref:c-SKI SMAD4-binding domain-containing protein n=1 Tax=Parelaphostrongylus tenuis TaxID=148309 RepID=A0AAD5QCV1_PARTN|nr:hypothetical protein KIN20_001730 [Parelaphostrongylus tenuis]